MYENAKVRPVENVPGISGGEMGERSGREEFKYDKFNIL
jgi:hypothetical protein